MGSGKWESNSKRHASCCERMKTINQIIEEQRSFISFPRFAWERMPGRFASACRQAVAELRTMPHASGERMGTINRNNEE